MNGRANTRSKLELRFAEGLLALLLFLTVLSPSAGLMSASRGTQSPLTGAGDVAPAQAHSPNVSLPTLTHLRTATPTPGGKGTDSNRLGTDYRVGKYASSRSPSEYRSSDAVRPLTNGVSSIGFLNGTGDSEMWYINVTGGARFMRAVVTGNPGNYVYLYGQVGVYPTTTSYSWSATYYGSTEDMSYYNPSAGTWYIMAYSDLSKGNYLLTVTVLYTSAQLPLTSGTPATSSLNATADSDLWYIYILGGATSMRAVLTCSSGADFDLYGMNGGYPTLTGYYWRGNQAGNEDVIYSYPGAGAWYIMPFSYSGNGTYQLTVYVAYAPVLQYLSNGMTATGTLNGNGDYALWYIYVAYGATSMHSVLTCPANADFNLYGAYGSYPTTTFYAWSGTASGDENTTYNNPSSGTWYIMVESLHGNGTYRLTVTVRAPLTPQSLYNGYTVSGNLSGTGEYDLWYMYLYNSAVNMHAVLTCPSGADFDLYGACGSYPTTLSYYWSGTASGDEDVNYPNPYYGDWYIMVYSSHGSGAYLLTVTVDFGGGNQPNPPMEFYAVVILFVVLFFAVVLAVSSRGGTGRPTGGSNYRPPEVPSSQPGMLGERRERIAPIRSVRCRSCGASLKSTDETCWNCGAPVKGSLAVSSVAGRKTGMRPRSGVCMVCKRGLENSDEILFCPYCGGLAHRDDFLEWLHVKDYCPTCGRHLDEAEVKKQTEPQPEPTGKKKLD
ncbi:MAG: pre-peptidase C-terminal domain-containing protein [Promethearchaeati archaeon SRVP18_Atabeyarchaeia-1]